MKRSITLIAILLMLLSLGNGCRNMHHRPGVSKDNTTMNFRGRGMDMRHNWGDGQRHMGRFMPGGPGRGMRGMQGGMGMGPEGMGRMGQMWGRSPMNGMGRGMGPMAVGRMDQGQMGPGRIIDNIPDLTDKQRKDIADLRQEQQIEMIKFRGEMAARMESMREANKTKMMNLLTDEQKKFVESKTGTKNFSPAKKN
jgi:hypothetical protein